MLFAAALLLASGLGNLAFAQNSSNVAISGNPFRLDPNDPTFTAANRTTACNAQRQSCPKLCPDGAYPNTCEEATLIYECTCNNGTRIDVTGFEQTLPYFECLNFRSQCVLATNDAARQQACNNIDCSPRGSPDAYAASMSASASPTPSPTTTPSNTPAQTPDASTSMLAGPTTAAAVALSQTFGTGALMAAILGAFNFLL